MLELCMSGHAFRIFLRSSLAQIMKAFIGRLMCGCPSRSLRGCRMILAPNIFTANESRPVILYFTLTKQVGTLPSLSAAFPGALPGDAPSPLSTWLLPCLCTGDSWLWCWAAAAAAAAAAADAATGK